MFIATNPEAYKGQVVGTGQCVAYVEVACKAPLTAKWKQGKQVKGNGSSIPVGAAIATFDPDGKYGNHTDGRSHGAIYVGQDAIGLQVWDQWLGQVVHQRTIRFQGGKAKPDNDGDCFYVVELADPIPSVETEPKQIT